MAKAEDRIAALEARIEALEWQTRIFAVQCATLLGVHAARLTNSEIFWKIRRTMNQAEPVVFPGAFNETGFERVAVQVRDELLSPWGQAEAEEAQTDVPARATGSAAD